MFDRFHSRQPYRYSRWDGTQHLDDLDGEEVLDALADDFLRDGDLRQALSRLMQRGFQGRDGLHRMGLRDLMNRLRQARQQRMNRYDLGSVLDDIAQRLERVKHLEREGIQRRLESTQAPTEAPAQGDAANREAQPHGNEAGQAEGGEGGQQSGSAGQQSAQQELPEGVDRDALRRALEGIAEKKRRFLDELPSDPAGQIKALSEYEFLDEQAREEFQALVEMLQQQVMQQYFQGMQQALQNMTPEDMARMREMVRALNAMLRQRAEGQEPDFDAFMQQYGDFFPGVNSLDDLIEQLQRNQAAMQAVMDSMTPEQREQLQGMVDQLLGDDRLRVDMAELAMNLDALDPSERRTRYRVRGDEPLSLAEAMHLMGSLQEMDALERQLTEARESGNLDDIDAQQLRDLVGAEEARALEELQALMRRLEEEGLLRREDDRLTLTARGIRRIGQKALQDIFANLKRDAFGNHRVPTRGIGGEREEESKQYTFGDPFLLHLQRTLMRGVHRNGAGTPLHLAAEDFEVYRTEHLTRSATVVMLDMSWSMLHNELWAPAKKVAIALDSLIRGSFPRDELFFVGFSNFAREFKTEELIGIGEWDHVQGTNMVHGLMLARKLLGRTRATNKQILMITDGGPTVWLENGHWTFDWPPPEAAITQTLREVHRCAREQITINVFMLWDEPFLKHFVNQMASVNRGRVFFTNPEVLGEYVLIDYLGHKQKRVG